MLVINLYVIKKIYNNIMGKTLFYKADEQPKVVTIDLTDVDNLYVNIKDYKTWKELNPDVKQLKPFNYRVLVVRPIEGELVEENKYVITTQTNAPVMRVMYRLGLCENPDGMTKEECEAVQYNSLKQAFSGNTEVEYFNEFKYFTQFTKLPTEIFAFTTNLKEITLPPTVVELTNYAFSFSSIRTINGLENVGMIGGYVFQKCDNLGPLNFTTTLKNIGGNAFGLCDSPYLTSLGDISGVQKLGNDCFKRGKMALPETISFLNLTSFTGTPFRDCYCFKTVYINPNLQNFEGSFNASKVERIPGEFVATKLASSSQFRNANDLKEIGSFNNVTSIGTYTFENCYKLESVGGFNEVTSIGTRAFVNVVRLPYIKFPKVNKVDERAFAIDNTLTKEGYFDGVEVIDRTVEFGLAFENITWGTLAFNKCLRTKIICNGVELTEAQYTQLGATKPNF